MLGPTFTHISTNVTIHVIGTRRQTHNPLSQKCMVCQGLCKALSTEESPEPGPEPRQSGYTSQTGRQRFIEGFPRHEGVERRVPGDPGVLSWEMLQLVSTWPLVTGKTGVGTLSAPMPTPFTHTHTVHTYPHRSHIPTPFTHTHTVNLYPHI